MAKGSCSTPLKHSWSLQLKGHIGRLQSALLKSHVLRDVLTAVSWVRVVPSPQSLSSKSAGAVSDSWEVWGRRREHVPSSPWPR